MYPCLSSPAIDSDPDRVFAERHVVKPHANPLNSHLRQDVSVIVSRYYMNHRCSTHLCSWL